ncbi:MAG: hypothetical protein EOP38_05480 [Rubrivivax sp.]|nr:MAG: hypothetical protein EOP38_05480 [Rubrivivax sp.]
MSTTATAPVSYKSKTLATWTALLGGPMGLHRFYLYGFGDLWGWLHPIPTLLGALGFQRVAEMGQDDHLAWLLIPVLGFMVAYTTLQAIVYGLMPDEKWHARFNPTLKEAHEAPASGWLAVFGVVLALLLGATVLMATIAFSGQRYFEYQVEEALKISQ